MGLQYPKHSGDKRLTGSGLLSAKEKTCQKPEKTKRQFFEHIELSAKPLDYFLRSNKSNINQSVQLFYL